MTTNSVLGLAFALLFPQALAWAQTTPPSRVPTDDEIRKILVQRIDEAKQSVGIVVGIIEPEGRRIVSYGALAKDDNRPLNGDTLFEIGSVTKVFTSLLLCDMVQRGEVALTDPLTKFLPPDVVVPTRANRVITLQDLSTHTSGLPRLPTNMSPKDPANPYADYSIQQLYQFLSSYSLTRDIGSQYEYSNLGGGLLGHVLTLRAKMDYEALVTDRITSTLGMSSTRIVLSTDLKSRLAVGHNNQLKPVANWDLPTLAGAGALRSTANDLLKFVGANLGYTTTSLSPAIAQMLSVRRPTGNPGLEIALGWHVLTRNGKSLVWHNGGTGGYRSFIGFDPKSRIGVVVLANAETVVGVDDIGLHLLDPASPVVPPTSPVFQPPKARTEIPMEPERFDAYVGQYQMAPNIVLTVERDGSRFYAQLTGQPKIEIFPEGERDFFIKAVDAQLTFEVDAQGRATAVILHQLGRDRRAARVESDKK